MKTAGSAAETKQNLTAEDWARAALDAIANGGIEAIAVEPLARQLGVTKGSFYWHFANREALLRAALELWERRETEEVMARVGDEADPYARIVKVFKEANAGYRSGRLYLAIAAAEDHPVVNEFVRRVSERRMGYLVECYEALGFTPARAQHWARFAYATFMGNLQIRRDTPDLMPTDAAFNEYLKLMIKTLIPREVAATSADDHPHVVPLHGADGR
ncbi:TetR/AcrR family transcriptional regulator [Sinimarinibacterium sp. CAU 1509]|uniref:TetR/AcrR family transcriptional regulator n=1 Tax=Sinimarinibacterium sp. CAU 1509 TaxID=2562283 RepID=UPI0010AC5046|nr:TetR/AcrR family transcriptional regulator [Sinimarinibacterium sp. CAU 1509]TJY59774.1 TetR/AcrR family transcriptional regulator [Sinimarinibacterium sp. CAU 1509]